MLGNKRPVAIGIATAALFLSALPVWAAEFTGRIGHVEGPGEPRHKALVHVAELVAERTDGAVELQIFPSAQLGNTRQLVEGVQFGSIEGAVTPTSFVTGFNPAAAVLDIPYIVPEDSAALAELIGGPFGEAVLESFDKRNMKGMALWLNGYKHFMSNKPVFEVDDFKGQRFRVMDSKILIEQFDALGASAIVLPFGELYTALQNGVVDGNENTLTAIEQMKFYEVQDYMSYSYHGALVDVVMINQAWWDSLPANYQEIVSQAFQDAVHFLEELDEESNAEAAEAIKKAGVEIKVLSDEEKAAIRELSYEPSRAAYLELTGAEGKNLLELYESEYERIMQ